MHPDLSAKVTTKIDDTKRLMDKNRLERMFHIGNVINIVNFQGKPKWLSGILEEQIGPQTFQMWLEDCHSWKRHVDHIFMNITTEPIVGGSEESNQPLRSRDKRLKGTQHLLHSFLLSTVIADSQQLVQAWEMIIPEPTSEHVCRNARRMKEGTMLRVKPKSSAAA